jgi:L-fucose isomerase-like protein
MTTIKRSKPLLALVITTWSHESGAAYARELVSLFPQHAPPSIDVLPCPTLLESEADIPAIVDFFAAHNPDLLCLIPGNFTLDHIMPLLAQALKLPTVLWGLPTLEAWGALVAVQQTVFPFKELNLPFRFVTGRLDDPQVWEAVVPYAQAAFMQQRLRGLRIGMMGWRAQGMSDVVFDELALREAFGVQIVNLGLTAYTRALQSIPEEAIEQAWSEIKPRFITDELPDQVGRYGVRSYMVLKDFVDQNALGSISLECFHDHLGGPCLGFCLLNDQSIPAPCEDDIPSAILMAAAQALTGAATFHTDIVEADYATNWAIFHHCGNMPASLASPATKPGLKPIRETAGPGAYGPTIQATMKPGPVTVANLVNGRYELRLCALQGDVLPVPMGLGGSGAKVAFPFSLRHALESIGNEGYGHHFVLIQGHVAPSLEAWCELSGVRYTAIY